MREGKQDNWPKKKNRLYELLKKLLNAHIHVFFKLLTLPLQYLCNLTDLMNRDYMFL